MRERVLDPVREAELHRLEGDRRVRGLDRLADREPQHVAERQLREVLRLQPGDATARFDLGWVLAERGARGEAEREWEQLLAGQPRGPIAERTRRELERLR